MGTALAQMLRADAGAAADAPADGSAGPVTPRSLGRSTGDQVAPVQDQPADQGTDAPIRSATLEQDGSGRGSRRCPDHHTPLIQRAARRAWPPQGLQAGIPACPAQRGHKGVMNALARQIGAELGGSARG